MLLHARFLFASLPVFRVELEKELAAVKESSTKAGEANEELGRAAQDLMVVLESGATPTENLSTIMAAGREWFGGVCGLSS